MGQHITLTASDGFALDGYEARPTGTARGGLVLIQEIFGVNGHIRNVADFYARAGYHVIAPALFDRAERAIELDYSEAGMNRGRALRGQLSWEQALADVSGAADALNTEGKCAILGYCYGGSVSWLAATRAKRFAAAVCYYGAQIAEFAGERPNCPVQMHFGEKDFAIPMADVGCIRSAQGADVEIQVYAASHGFHCDERASYDEPSAVLAQARTLTFLEQYIA